MRKKVYISIAVLLAALAMVVSIIVSLNFANTNFVTKKFANTSDVLLNPGKGFVDYGNLLYGGGEEYISVGYHRFNWCDIEPQEGQYNFEKIDDWIAPYARHGKKFAFGVMSVNTSDLEETNVTPQYVFDKGAKYFEAKLDSGIYQKVPDWKDSVYLECVDKLVAALGKKYNSDENIVFIDILSYGNWGEQHLFHLDVKDYPDYMKKEKISAQFFKENYVKPYMEAFPDKLLLNPWGEEDFNDVYIELIDEGVSLRRDGIVSYTNGLDILEKCYGKLPVVFEYAGNYKDYIPKREKYFNNRLKEAINIAKPSYIELDKDWFEHNKKLCAQIANQMGYYFRLKKASYYRNVDCGEDTNIFLTFANDGVAPLYENCSVFIGLLDENGNVKQKYLTDLNAKKWQPNKQYLEEIKINFGEQIEGKYKLAVGLFENNSDDKPTYLLGSKCPTQDKWYILGDININSAK